MVLGWEPEVAYFDVPVLNLGLFNPNGRILGRFSFNPNDGEVLRIHPDLPAIEKLVLGLGQEVNYVLLTVRCDFIASGGEIVVLPAYCGMLAVFLIGSLLLA